MLKYYVAVSALIFALVALVHLVRLAKRWPVQIGSLTIPITASWIGFLIAAFLAIWGFAQLGY